jgi:hypothetical protein
MMIRLLLIFAIILLAGCLPKTGIQEDYFSRNAIPPERQISFEGRVGKLASIGEDMSSLVARGATAVSQFSAPASTLYQFSESDNQFYVCEATGRVFEIRLIFTDARNNTYLTPFGIGFLSFLDELQNAGLRDAGERDNVLYFSYGYDASYQLVEPVGFYIGFDKRLNRVTFIDLVSAC